MTDDTAPATEPAQRSTLDFDPVPVLARELGLQPGAIGAVIAMLDEGNTVPFIARYRKERTGGLDEVQIRAIEEKREYHVELETRRAAILVSVSEQGKLTPELEAKLRGAEGKSELEDLYAPYRPRRKTRASVAREKGLGPLAEKMLAQGSEGDPAAEAAAFVAEGVANADEALAGARDIVAETIADTAEVRAFVRREYAEHGELVSTVVPGKADEPTKFEQYYSFGEAVRTIPSHRFLAIRRGEAEGVLRAQVIVDTQKVGMGIERLVNVTDASPWAGQLRLAIADALKRLLAPSVENDVRAELKQRSDGAAVDIFAGNLRNLMLAAPLGSAAVLGVDPGLRTGCKCAAIDATGKFLGTVTIYITQGDAQLAKAKEDFIAFVQKFTPKAIAVGNGTGGREAEQFVKRAVADAGLREGPDAPFVVQVNEAGASVYSASDLAREEFPELDLTIRGAISIARRLQDPLAELVKIEPKSIGVGQYQHDVHQPLLAKKLGDVVEDCVNKVGVELNTASAQLLGYVAGIGKSLAKKIVLHRDSNGKFTGRAQLMEVSGLGPKAFEQAAGFMRIAGAANPLDQSAVHPERYPLVEKIAADLGVELPQLIGNQELVDKIDLSKYVSDEVGEPTLRDITAELAKPGRDPREEFAPPQFRDDVTSMEDLKPGMVLEGIVTNVTAFGAFVDIGVHNDGLVHVSQLAEQFVKDPSEVVKVGQKLTVRVLEVDNQRKRIALSAKRGGQPQQRQQRQGQGGEGQQQQGNRRGGRGRGGGGQPRQSNQGPQRHGDQPMGDAQLQGDQAPSDQPSMQGEQGGGRRQWRDRGAPGVDQNQLGGEPMQGDPNAQQGQPAPGQGQPAQGRRGRGGRNRNQTQVWQGPTAQRAPIDGDQGGQGSADQGGQGSAEQGAQATEQGPHTGPQGPQGGQQQHRGGGPQGGRGRGGGPGSQQGGRGRGPGQGQGNWQGGPNQGGQGNWNQGGPRQGQGNWNQGQGGQGNWQGGQGGQGNWNQGGQGGQGNWNQGGPGPGGQGPGGQGPGGQGNWNQGGPGQGGQGQGGQGHWNQGGPGQGPGGQGNWNQGGPGGQGNWNQGGPGQGGQGPGGQGNWNQGGQGGQGNWNQGGQGNWQGNQGPRGPGNQGGSGGGRRDDRGPRRDDRGGGGPRFDDRGPRRDDRGPRRDDQQQRREEPPPNWGVQGFKNNPFAAKLPPVTGGAPSRGGGDKDEKKGS